MKRDRSRRAAAAPSPRHGPAANPWALVLAGGEGTRLREFTRAIAGMPMPKQYCRLLEGRSLLEATLDRMTHITSRDRILVSINRDHLGVARHQLGGLASDNILVEPCNRDTGPGLLFALFHLTRRDPNATVAVFPSDHYVGDGSALAPYVQQAVQLVTQWPAKVVILGVPPDRVEPGFGHIIAGEPLSVDNVNAAAFRVDDFVEKPTPEAARMLRAQGGLWNTFVMVFRAPRMIDLVRTWKRKEFDHMRTVCDHPRGWAAAYETLRPWNVSRHLLTRILPSLIVLRVDDLHWNDWGTPQSIYYTLQRLNQAPPWRLPAAPASPRDGRSWSARGAATP